MGGSRIPGPIGSNPEADVGTFKSCRAGSQPGPLGSQGTPTARVPLVARTPYPSKEIIKPRFTTDAQLLCAANTVLIAPAWGQAVFYAEDVGAELAAAFVASNPGHARLDELLAKTAEGRTLWASLTESGRPWCEKEEVWWVLSHRLARSASGRVHVFGPDRLTANRPYRDEEFRHKHLTQTSAGMRAAYANTVFEKVEWPELEQNLNVTEILYNGKRYCDDEG